MHPNDARLGSVAWNQGRCGSSAGWRVDICVLFLPIDGTAQRYLLICERSRTCKDCVWPACILPHMQQIAVRSVGPDRPVSDCYYRHEHAMHQ